MHWILHKKIKAIHWTQWIQGMIPQSETFIHWRKQVPNIHIQIHQIEVSSNSRFQKKSEHTHFLAKFSASKSNRWILALSSIMERTNIERSNSRLWVMSAEWKTRKSLFWRLMNAKIQLARFWPQPAKVGHTTWQKRRWIEHTLLIFRLHPRIESVFALRIATQSRKIECHTC